MNSHVPISQLQELSTCDYFCFLHNLTHFPFPGVFGSKFEKLYQRKYTYGAVIYKNRYHMKGNLKNNDSGKTATYFI